jgi:hypothetical protein
MHEVACRIVQAASGLRPEIYRCRSLTTEHARLNR